MSEACHLGFYCLAAETNLGAAIPLPLFYVGDAIITLLQRLAICERLTHAHRGHFYQRALIGGQNVYSIVGRVFLLNIMLIALSGIATAISSAPVQIAAIAAGRLLVGWQLYRFEQRVV